MAEAVELVVGTEHGPDCTCQRLDAIEFNVTPVVVNNACPSLGQPTGSQEYAGRLIVTWPAPKGAVVNGWGVTLHDADTGEQIITAVKLALVLGSESGFSGGAVEAEVTALTDTDGNILPAGAPIVATDEYLAWRTEHLGEGGYDGPQYRTGVFRFIVAEMRVGSGSSNPVDGGC